MSSTDKKEKFADLGICKELCEACASLNWKQPTEIQKLAIPHALKGKDIIGLAETGSGKTAAFSIPIIQDLLSAPRYNFALIMTPTRELALQTHDQFQALGSSLGLRSVCLVGGQHMQDQVKELNKRKYHIIIGTPGRLVDHLENTKTFRLNRVRYVVLDEADIMLRDCFEHHVTTLLAALDSERITFLYSATMTEKLVKLERASLKTPVRLEVSDNKFHTVDKLSQSFVFLADQEKELYLVGLLMGVGGEVSGHTSVIVFTATWRESSRLAAILKLVGVEACALNGGMSQDKRQTAIDKFRRGNVSVLVATDLASRGLDIPLVDVVVNYTLPDKAKTYLHRVGRTARAGRAGKTVAMVTPYTVARLKWIEAALGGRLVKREVPRTQLEPLKGKVESAARQAKEKIRDSEKQKKSAQRKNKEDKKETKIKTVDQSDSD